MRTTDKIRKANRLKDEAETLLYDVGKELESLFVEYRRIIGDNSGGWQAAPDYVESISINSDEVWVSGTYSCRGCSDSCSYRLPLSLVEASPAKRSNILIELKRKHDENVAAELARKAAEKEATERAELLRLQEKYQKSI